MAALGRDIKLSIKRIEGIEIFRPKSGTPRFAQTYLKDCTPSDWDAPAGATEAWIRSRLAATQETVSGRTPIAWMKQVTRFTTSSGMVPRLVHRAGEAPAGRRASEQAAARAALADALNGVRLLHLLPLRHRSVMAALPESLRETESLSQAAIRVEVARDRASEAKVALAIEAVSLLRGLQPEGIAQRERSRSVSKPLIRQTSLGRRELLGTSPADGSPWKWARARPSVGGRHGEGPTSREPSR